MCIAIKTYSCGAKEHLYHLDCTEKDCNKYINYVAAPGKCFHCNTRNDDMLIQQARDYPETNTSTKAYAWLNVSDEDKAEFEVSKLKDKKDQPASPLEHAQGAAPSLVDRSPELFPDLGKYLGSKAAATTKDGSSKENGDKDDQTVDEVSGVYASEDGKEEGEQQAEEKNVLRKSKNASKKARQRTNKRARKAIKTVDVELEG